MLENPRENDAMVGWNYQPVLAIVDDVSLWYRFYARLCIPPVKVPIGML
jgi:hypothetical protein